MISIGGKKDTYENKWVDGVVLIGFVEGHQWGLSLHICNSSFIADMH